MEFDPRESRALVDSAASGDGTAVDRLLVRYLPLVRGHLRGKAGRLLTAKESTADLVQSVCREVLEQVREQRFEYRGEPEFRAWLLQQALHKLHARARYWQAGKRDAGREADPSDPIEELARTGVSPSRDAAGAEELERHQRAFAALSEEHRQIIRLVRLQGMSHAEAGQALGIDAAHSRMRLSRALSRLARLAVDS